MLSTTQLTVAKIVNVVHKWKRSTRCICTLFNVNDQIHHLKLGANQCEIVCTLIFISMLDWLGEHDSFMIVKYFPWSMVVVVTIHLVASVRICLAALCTTPPASIQSHKLLLTVNYTNGKFSLWLRAQYIKRKKREAAMPKSLRVI